MLRDLFSDPCVATELCVIYLSHTDNSSYCSIFNCVTLIHCTSQRWTPLRILKGWSGSRGGPACSPVYCPQPELSPPMILQRTPCAFTFPGLRWASPWQVPRLPYICVYLHSLLCHLSYSVLSTLYMQLADHNRLLLGLTPSSCEGCLKKTTSAHFRWSQLVRCLKRKISCIHVCSDCSRNWKIDVHYQYVNVLRQNCNCKSCWQTLCEANNENTQ